MHETKVSTLGHPFETSPSALLVHPINLAGCSLPGGLSLLLRQQGRCNGADLNPSTVGQGQRWENLAEIRTRHRHRHCTKLGGPASSPWSAAQARQSYLFSICRPLLRQALYQQPHVRAAKSQPVPDHGPSAGPLGSKFATMSIYVYVPHILSQGLGAL